MSTRDYSNLPAAISDETISSLRESYETALSNAESHRSSAEHYQEAADRERHYADRDEERARQWKMQLDFAEQQAARDAEAAAPTVADVADAERYAQRDEYVNAVPDFKPSDLVNICDPGHKLFGIRGSVIGYVYDPDGVVVEYDNLGNTVTVTASQLMHHTEFVKLPDEYFAAAEQAAREVKSVRQIEREIAIEAGDDAEDGEL